MFSFIVVARFGLGFSGVILCGWCWFGLLVCLFCLFCLILLGLAMCFAVCSFDCLIVWLVDW